MSGRDQFKRFKMPISLLIGFFKLFGKSGNRFFLKFHRNTNGRIGLLLRYVFLKNLCKKCGDNVSVHPGVFLFHLPELELGSNVSIHPMCYLEAAGGIKIGNDVSIAHSSSLVSVNHSWDNPDIPIKYNKENLSPIQIDDDVWIGAGVRILAGIRLKKRTVVAAGAVVNKSFEENSLIGGVPAKLIKELGKER